jgi:coenzyme F420-0:L-glutamate ligase / coenzyme F420-1:gamma-L-glutamate ligase
VTSELPSAAQTLELMRRRRTARRHGGDGIPQAALDSVLAAVRWAPSAANRQPWELVVISDPGVKQGLRAAFLADAATHGTRYQTVTERQADLLLAPLLIGICADERTKASFVNADEIGSAVQEELLLLSMGAAIQNLLLMATAVGLTSTWLARPARLPQARELLAVDPWIRIVAFVALGAGDPPPRRDEHARSPIAAKVHRDRFGARAS